MTCIASAFLYILTKLLIKIKSMPEIERYKGYGIQKSTVWEVVKFLIPNCKVEGDTLSNFKTYCLEKL